MAPLFMAVVTLLLIVSIRQCWLVLSKRKPAVVNETPYVEQFFESKGKGVRCC